MSYTSKDFGADLLAELAKGFDVVRLSRWAMRLHMERCLEMDDGLTKQVMAIIAMEEGPEFEYSEEELRAIAEEIE